MRHQGWTERFNWQRSLDTPLLRKIRGPEETAARNACNYYFPPRANIMVQICDFFAEEAKSYRRPLGGIEEAWANKRPEVEVRWIHIPVGIGLLQSTLEDLFLHAGVGKMSQHKLFKQAGKPGWPYTDLNVLTFYNHDYSMEMLEALDLLSKDENLKRGTSDDELVEMQPTIKDDLKWRSRHLGEDINFWSLVKADFPLQLGEQFGSDDQGPLDGKLLRISKSDRQVLSLHPQYTNSLLAVSRLRAFHRSDGFLLTFGNTTGVDYLSRDFESCLKLPNDVILQQPEFSVIAHVMTAFENSGTSRWHRRTVEWLVVYLFTESAVTPHSMRGGMNAISPLNAYKELTYILQREQELPWKKGQSPKLVKRYLSCLRELRGIHSVISEKLDKLRGMQEDCEAMEREYQQEGKDIYLEEGSDSMASRLEWAIRILERKEKDIKVMIPYVQTALKELFNLRTIEQNDLAIVADNQNKALFVFTGVTVVFLPLSFFTSYFGMNLAGISNTDKDEYFFWKTCGVGAIMMSAMIILLAYWYEIRRALRWPKRAVEDNW
ncbi:uncharacterized protein BCR38DRAFT_353305 [Pseudomassariella vexata]|uniref:Uncharacterized protein n=1 Tax=Pseudomassariella vexata TaxID=1141098 RepID=A0A1Y2DG09_9PEZI|nr:uncharacterized protein BCR38DRAFT_353305 [Pseudomassariella vexata]ORY58220.1 hypothetical protein BCR38DRAFT_353305 [Pseudomassariella vexata]